MKEFKFSYDEIFLFDEQYDPKNVFDNNININIIPSPLYEGLIDHKRSQYNIFGNAQKWNEYDDSVKDEDIYCLNDLVEDYNIQLNEINNKNQIILFFTIKKLNKPKKNIKNKITIGNNDINNSNQIRKKLNKENMGRIKTKEKNNKNIDTNKVFHDKLWKDNIRIKFKRVFIKYMISFVNTLITISSKSILLKQRKIVKLNNKIIKNNKRSHILEMLNISAKDYLSHDISSRIKTLPRDNNKKVIEYIYEIDEKNIIEVLNKSIRELMHIFCSDCSKDNIFKHFKRLQYFIDNELIQKNHEDPNYILKFKEQALHYEEEIKKIDGRNM